MRFFFSLFILLNYVPIAAQSVEEGYRIFKTAEIIQIDGLLKEKVWQNAQKGTGFTQHYPYDTALSTTQTEFLMCYDNDAMYCAFICYNRNPEKDFVLQSLKRDFSITNNDAVVLTLSPFLDGQNGFSFGVTPENSQREGVIENGGNFGVSTAWDQIWYSATHITRDTWIAEFEIPFKSIRFSEGKTEWAINVLRADFKNNEISTWKKVPRNFNISQLSFSKPLIWDHAPIRKGPNIALIPYVSNLSSASLPYSEPFSTHTPRFGFDAKIGLSSSLNLDITVNPDFAQVDVDVQQINLTRFSLFFPERRQFFIENSDLFGNFGFRQIRPFFSRRVGLGNTGNIPIDAGARVTGKIGNLWRIGAMVVQTRDSGLFEPGSKNYMVTAIQRKIFSSSNIGFIAVNEMDGAKNSFGNDASTVTGLEYNLQSKDNKWVGKAFVQKAFANTLGSDNWSHATFLIYQNLKWSAMWNHEYVGKDFRAKTGFVPRIENFDPILNKTRYLSYWRLEPNLRRTFYPKSKTINHYSFGTYNSSYYDSVGNVTESYSTVSANVVLQNSAEFRVVGSHNFHNLYVPFIPVRSVGYYLMGQYSWLDASVGFTSNNRKKLSGLLDMVMGNYYNGTRFSINGSLQYRKQPWGVFSITYRRENIDLDPYGSSVFNLFGAKADISFTTTMYFTAFLQYNTQAENVNLNLRYQWRFAPLSDLFVVYSENYLPEFSSKNRTLALKFVYWFNT